MYVSFSFENIITIGVMLAIWMIALHAAAQIGLRLPDWTGLGGN